MIPARKSGWFTALFARHARSRIFGTFGRVFVSGLDDLRGACARGPVLVVANHTSWWDPLVALWLTNLVLHVDSYALMDATNLRRLPFFGRVGAFGVELSAARDGARSIRYAARLLDRPGRVVWIYPEGGERSAFGPLELRPGSALVARVARRARVVCVGVRYVFASAERPELWVSIGAAGPALRDVDAELARQRDGIGAELRRIDARLAAAHVSAGDGAALVAGHAAGFALLAERRPGLVARAAERLLAWFVRALPSGEEAASPSGDDEPAAAVDPERSAAP